MEPFRCFQLLQSLDSKTVKVKWGKESYPDVELNTDEPPLLFKAQLFALTGVQPERQKVMMKGKVITDDFWEGFQVKEVSIDILNYAMS